MTIKCPICKGKEYRVLFPSTLTKEDFKPEIVREHLKNSLGDYKKHSQIVKCAECELVYVNPQEDIRSLERGYKEVKDEEYLETEKFRKIVLQKRLSLLEKFKKRGRLLDVGCFAGYFLELAKASGWEVYGIEPSRWAVKIANKRGLTILGSAIETTRLKDSFFDAVVLLDVLEHLPNPSKALIIIKKALKPKGILAIATPNIESLFAKVLGGRNPYLARMHVVFYSPKTLAKLLRSHDFEVIYQSTYARVFPLWYILKRIGINNRLFRLFEFPISLDFKDAFVMIAKKR